MKITQSYFATVMRGNLSLYEMRIILKICEFANTLMNGKTVREYISQAVCLDGRNYNLTLRAAELLEEGNTHYEDVYEAAARLQKRIISVDETWHQIQQSSPILYNIRNDKRSGVIEFSCSSWFIEMVLDFSKGFQTYLLDNCLRLRSVYAIRYYIMFCGCIQPLTLSIDFLRAMFGVDGINPETGRIYYAQTADFLKRCVAPAAQELETANINGFRWEPRRDSRGKVTAVTIYPVKREILSAKEITARAGLSTWCDPVLKNYLLRNLNFTSRELSAHKDVLYKFGALPYWPDKLYQIAERQRRKRASKGYIISSIKSVVQEATEQGVYKLIAKNPKPTE